MAETSGVGHARSEATRQKLRNARNYMHQTFTGAVAESVVEVLSNLINDGWRGLTRSARLRSKLRAVLDDLLALGPGALLDEAEVHTRLIAIKRDLSAILDAAKVVDEVVVVKTADESAIPDHMRQLAARAISSELKLQETTNQQAQGILLELRAGLNRLSEAEDEARRRNSSLMEEVASSLARVSDAEADSRKTLQNLQAEYVQLQDHLRAESESHLGRAQSIVGHLEQYRTEAKELLKVVGENGASAGYRAEADKSKFSRLVWQILTVVFFAMWIAASGLAFYLTRELELTWALAARQFVVSLPFVLLSAFGALQVSRSNATDLLNQRAALEIHALGPLLAGLPDEDQVRVRGAIIPRFFGTEVGPLAEASRVEAGLAPDAAVLLGKITELLKTAPK